MQQKLSSLLNYACGLGKSGSKTTAATHVCGKNTQKRLQLPTAFPVTKRISCSFKFSAEVIFRVKCIWEGTLMVDVTWDNVSLNFNAKYNFSPMTAPLNGAKNNR